MKYLKRPAAVFLRTSYSLDLEFLVKNWPSTEIDGMKRDTTCEPLSTNRLAVW